ncbi:MAG: hypothetical protein JWO94_2239 [Verrucomicrobiaceae bacterium]|nr:hypothetical protein [Verrucomicrobiaceae bacterium]
MTKGRNESADQKGKTTNSNQRPANKHTASFVIRHSSFVIRHSSFVFYHSSPVLDFTTILYAILPTYITMLVGGLCRKWQLLPKEADAGLMRLAVNLLYPCLIIERIVGNPEVNYPWRVLAAASLGFGLAGLGIWLGYLAAPTIGLKNGEGRRTFAMTTGIQNYGFVAIPVISALFPNGRTLGVMFTFTLGVELAVWTLGVGILTGLNKAPWKAALNAPVLAILAALALNFLGAAPYIPAPLHSVMNSLGNCSVPLSVVLIGASIADMWRHERFNWPVAMMSAVLRQLIIPIAFVLAAWLLPLTDDLKRVLVVQGAMPSAVFSIVLARHYGGHPPTAVQVILATTAASLITTPLMISLVVQWLKIGP